MTSQVELDFNQTELSEKHEKTQSDINEQLYGLRSVPRTETLIAIFENGHAVGWKFYVKEVFKEALDIRFTPITVNQHSFNTWTQGYNFSFKDGDIISSHDSSDWKSFLQQENAIMLKVRFTSPSGFEENKRLDGKFTGDFYSSKGIKSAKRLVDIPVNVSSQIFDHGSLTVDVLRPNKEKNAVETVEELTLTQSEFVTLLQRGFYWKKVKADKKQDISAELEKIILIP